MTDLARAAYAQLCLAVDALELGEGDFEAERDALVKRLRAAWGKDGYRIKAVHIENVAAAYVRATVEIMNTPELRAVFPYWMFSAAGKSAPCQALNGVVRPAGEEWWFDGRIPPMHLGGCSSVIEPLTLDEAQKIGVTPYYPTTQAAPGLGKVGEFAPDVSGFPPELVAVYEKAREG